MFTTDNNQILLLLGEFGSWTEWSECSTTCGKGTRNRTRTCQGPFECKGEDTETEACPNNPPCIANNVENIQDLEECNDNPYLANCKMIVKAGNCSNKYYAKFCCKSCTIAGQL